MQDMFTRKDLKSGRVLGEKLTMAHALFSRSVFNSIGYFEQVRFGADWEYWERLKMFNKLNNLSVTNHMEALGESFVHKTNLTVQIPIGSLERKRYMKQTLKRLKKDDNLYMPYDYLTSVTKKIT